MVLVTRMWTALGWRIRAIRGSVCALGALTLTLACAKPKTLPPKTPSQPLLIVDAKMTEQKAPRPPEWSFWEPVPVAVTPSIGTATLPRAEKDAPRDVVSSPLYASLSESEKQLLWTYGFVVRTTKPERHLHEFYTKKPRPADVELVTLDALFAVFHAASERLLAELENDVTRPALALLLARLDASLSAGVRRAKTDLVRAAWLARGLVAVARELLDPAYDPEPEFLDVVNAEADLVRAHAGVAKSPLLGHVLDYGQFRGTGLVSAASSGFRVWQASQWLSHAPLVLSSKEERASSPQNTSAARDATRAAMLLARQSDDAVDGAAQKALDTLHRVLRFAFGPPDDGSLVDMQDLADEAHSDLGDERVLGNAATVERFRKRMIAMKKPRLYDGVVPASRHPKEPGESSVQFATIRFLPVAWTEDAHALQIIANSGSDEHATGALSPSGVDLVAYLGSQAARVAHRLAVDSPADHDALFAILEKSHPAETAPSRHASIFASYLDAIASYVSPSAADPSQPLAASDGWQLHRAESGLSAWATLRHDALLFGRGAPPPLRKVVPTEPAPASPAGSAVPARAFVEPHVEALTKLVALWLQVGRGLRTIETPPSEAALSILTEVEELFRAALSTALAEVAGRPALGAADVRARLVRVSEELSGDEPAESGLVAIAHGHAAGARVLEVGTGFFEEVVSLVRDPATDKFVLARGPATPYFEDAIAAAKVSTDSEWRTRMALGAPPRPGIFQVYRAGSK